ncbi:MAG: type IV pilin protein [Porticoccus sp.]
MMPKSRGFTLIEVMIVVAIIAILVGIAIPNYREYVIRANRAVAKGAILEVASRQEQYFVNNRSYTHLLADLDYPVSYYIDSEGQPLEAAAGSIYQITITDPDSNTGETTYSILATPQNGQVEDTRCLNLGIDDQAEKTETGSEDRAYCW